MELDGVDILGHPDNDLMRYSVAAYLQDEFDLIPTDVDGQPSSRVLETRSICSGRHW